MPPDQKISRGPIEPRELLKDPSPKLIEEAGVWQLARALNIGRVVAFVGSGVPMAYGRISWRGMVEVLVGKVLDDYNKMGEPKSLKDLKGRIETLLHENPATNQYPTLFQLAELMHEKLRSLNGGPEGGLRETLAIDTYDDRGQGKELIRKVFEGITKKAFHDLEPEIKYLAMQTRFKKEEKKFIIRWFGYDKKFKTSREMLAFNLGTDSTHSYRFLFTRINLDEVYRISQERKKTKGFYLVKPLLDVLAQAETAKPNGLNCNKKQLIALHRFALSAHLRWYLTSQQNSRDAFKKLEQALLGPSAEPPNGAAAAASRADTISAARDPLLILHERLRIDRFLTTNYDLDIERLFHDLGYTDDIAPGRPVSPSGFVSTRRADRLEPLGSRSRDLVLDQYGHGRLIDFATQDRRNRPQLVHVHGRATHDDNDQMVVTELDYQLIYQRDGFDRLPMEVARRVAFGGNPLLFVGLGLGEDDILLPLRHFMGQENRLGDRLAVAIMPGSKYSNERLLEQMTLLNRYGVYALYYGSATIETESGNLDIEDWLAYMIDIINCLVKLADSNETKFVENRDHLKAALDKAAESMIFKETKIDGYISYKIRKVVVLGKAEDYQLDPETVISFEGKVLEACLALARSIEFDQFTPAIRMILRISAEGVRTSLQTSCLCSRLMALETEWDSWKRELSHQPKPRPPPNQPFFDVNPTTKMISKWFLHHEDGKVASDGRRNMGLPPLSNTARADRFYENPPSRALRVVQAAMRQNRVIKIRRFQGRRIFLLLSRPGIGKGHVFTALAGPERLAKFFSASWGQQIEGRPFALCVGAAFYNLSFSHEVATVFERVTIFLENQWERVFPPQVSHPIKEMRRTKLAESFKLEIDSLKNDRFARLRNALDHYQSGADLQLSERRRLVIVFNNIGAMYDFDGKPKNVGLGRQFIQIVSAAPSAPIDFVFICTTDSVPQVFRKDAADCAHEGENWACKSMLRLLPTQSNREHTSMVMALEEQLNLLPCGDHPTERSKSPRDNPILICHVLRRSQVMTLATSFFPKVALSLAAKAWRAGGSPDLSETVNPEHIVALQSEMQKDFDEIIDINGTSRETVGLMYQTFRAENINFEAVKAEIEDKKLKDEDKNLKDSVLNLVADKFRDFASFVSQNRFASTLLLAAADERLGKTKDALIIKESADALQFLEQAKSQLRGVEPQARDSTIVDIVFASMELRHRQRCEPPISLDFIARLGPRLHHLILLLLWHVAVIGEPVAAEVLAACPKVKRAVSDLETAGEEVKPSSPSIELIKDAIKLLVHRCLLFNADRHGSDEKPRYGVHRLIQHVVFRQLDTPTLQNHVLDRFTVSLYIDQPSDLPRPSPEAHWRLRNMVEELSGFDKPDDEKPEPDEGWAELESRKLRAAFGVIRSVYHVAVIGRFDDYGRQDPRGTPPTLGQFEAHRLLVGWLLRRAMRLNQYSERMLKPENSEMTPPFYAEEIIWLLNESGVLSLAQGRINDATALFAHALSLAREWISPIDKALAARIGINAALTDIERGSAGRARSNLDRIISNEGDDNVIRGICTGLIGLTDHLAGEFDSADAKYELAIATLTASRCTRAASFFSRHRGDLCRVRGEAYFAKAREYLAVSETLARQGGHEDIAQLARLTHASLLVADGKAALLVEALGELDKVEAYGQAVGLPRILAEVAVVRAEAVIRQGETRGSTELAAQALTICTLHDLRLFKVRALAAVATAFSRQGVPDSADIVRRRAEELAGRSRYTAMASQLGASNFDFGRLAE